MSGVDLFNDFQVGESGWMLEIQSSIKKTRFVIELILRCIHCILWQTHVIVNFQENLQHYRYNIIICRFYQVS